MKDKDKLKLAAVIQNLATLGAGLGASVPILAEWGKGQQQLASNYARAVEQKIAQKQAKKNKRSGLLGALGGLLGIATGGLASPLVGAIGGIAGSSIGQLVGGGEFNPIMPIQYGIQGYGTGVTAKQIATDRAANAGLPITNVRPKFSDIIRGVSISSGIMPSVAQSTNYYVVKVDGQPMVVDPATFSVISSYDMNKKKIEEMTD